MDFDGDGVSNVDELKFGSGILNAASTPEDADYDPDTCSDGVDNDGDGRIDAADSGCGPAGLPRSGGKPATSSIPWITFVVAALIATSGGLMLTHQNRRAR